jgi:hypothetical protein
MQLSDIGKYLKEQAIFLGSTFLFTVVGGIIGAIVAWVISWFTGVPVLQSAIVAPAYVALAPLGALAGFVTSFLRRILA